MLVDRCVDVQSTSRIGVNCSVECRPPVPTISCLSESLTAPSVDLIRPTSA